MGIRSLAAPVGQYGATYFADATGRNGNWFAIYVIASLAFTSLTANDWDGATVSASDTFTGGVTLYGDFTRITLASGVCVAYKRKGDGA